MINSKTITKKQAKQLLILTKQMVRAEVMARVGPTKGLEFGDYFTMSREKRDGICKLIFGTADYVQLGIKFGMLYDDGSKKKKRRKRK